MLDLTEKTLTYFSSYFWLIEKNFTLDIKNKLINYRITLRLINTLCQFIVNDKGKAEQQLPFLAFACYFFQFPDHMIYYHYPIILIISCNWWVLEHHIRLSTVLKWKYAIRPVTCSRYVTSSKRHRVNFKWCESIFCNAITNPNS